MLTPLTLALALSRPAYAEDGFDAHGFVLAPQDSAVLDPLTVQSASRYHPLDWYAAGVWERADRPLVYVTDQVEGAEIVPYLDDLMALNLSAGVAVHSRARLEVAAPLYLMASGADGQEGAGVGDVRVQAGVSLYGPKVKKDGLPVDGVSVGLVPYLDLPSGDASRYLGAGGLAGGGKVAVSWQDGGKGKGAMRVSADAGYQANPTITLDNLSGADTVQVGAAFGYQAAERLGVVGEAHAAIPTRASDLPGTATPAEALVSLRGRQPTGLGYTLGGGTALSAGAGAAAWRVLAGVSYAPTVDRDPDGDSFIGKKDACPTGAEVINTWKDSDGCPDALADVQIRTFLEGQQVSGAEIELNGPSGRQDKYVSGPDPVGFTTMPEQAWTGRAVYQSCYTADLQLQTQEGLNRQDLALARTAEARISYRVVNEKGVPIEGVRVRYLSDAPGCIPTEALTLSEKGTGDHVVGAGSHTLIVEAPNYAVLRVPIEVRASEGQFVELSLKSTRVRLEEKQIVILEKVFFEYNKAVILAESFPLLNEVADTILANPQVGVVEVAGHTDADGKDDVNLRLSDDRAKAVAEYLIARGVPKERLQAHGYGEARPIADNRTPKGKAMNRRVEFNFVGSMFKPPQGEAPKDAPAGEKQTDEKK